MFRAARRSCKRTTVRPLGFLRPAGVPPLDASGHASYLWRADGVGRGSITAIWMPSRNWVLPPTRPIRQPVLHIHGRRGPHRAALPPPPGGTGRRLRHRPIPIPVGTGEASFARRAVTRGHFPARTRNARTSSPADTRWNGWTPTARIGAPQRPRASRPMATGTVLHYRPQLGLSKPSQHVSACPTALAVSANPVRWYCWELANTTPRSDRHA